MVLAERGDNLRNGRRSRGPSPNGHGTPDSSSEDETATKRIGNSKSNTKSGTYEAEKIRVGRDYQATCPDLEPVEDRKPEQLAEKALLVWSPTKEIPDQKLEDYITVAKDKYGYNGEQALGMLFWHKHDLERAVLDLANFTPFPDEWTVEDKVLFEQAFQFHGKTFHRIRQMLPDKSIAALVKYYYSWKKTRTRSSVMDRQVKKHEAASENGSEHSNEESDTEEKVQSNKQVIGSLKRKAIDCPGIEDLRPPQEISRVTSKWSNEELMLAVQCVRKYGKDFVAIAEAIGTKTEQHVRSFFVSYRRRYNLDLVLKDYEIENGLQMDVEPETIVIENSPPPSSVSVMTK